MRIAAARLVSSMNVGLVLGASALLGVSSVGLEGCSGGEASEQPNVEPGGGDLTDSGPKADAATEGDGGTSPDATDSGKADAAPDGPRCDLAKPFGAPMPIPGLPTTAETVRGTSDELAVVYDRTRSSDPDLYVATRADRSAPFAGARKLSELTTPRKESASVTGDGTTIYFGSLTTSSLHKATRSAGTGSFGLPGELFADHEMIASPFVTSDGKTLVVVARRTAGEANVLKFSDNGGALAPVPFSSQADGSNGFNPVLSEDRKTLYFARVEDSTSFFVWFATRADASARFGAPTKVAELATTQALPSWVSPDGCTLYLTRKSQAPYASMVTRPR